jgi:uncharacterized membrane protein
MMHGGYWDIGRGLGMYSNYYWLFLIAKGVFWFVLIYLAYRLFKKYNGSNVKDDEALEALKTRFVKGELTEEVYLHKRNLLNE